MVLDELLEVDELLVVVGAVVVVDVVVLVVLVIVVLVLVPVPGVPVGTLVVGTGTLFGQYLLGYPRVSRRSPTHSKCIPSAGQKFPPHANPHLRKMRTMRQSICGGAPCAFVTVFRSMAAPNACRDGEPNIPANRL